MTVETTTEDQRISLLRIRGLTRAREKKKRKRVRETDAERQRERKKRERWGARKKRTLWGLGGGDEKRSGLRRKTTKGPMWGHPMPVLGALSPFLEPFHGHLSPKVDEIFQK